MRSIRLKASNTLYFKLTELHREPPCSKPESQNSMNGNALSFKSQQTCLLDFFIVEKKPVTVFAGKKAEVFNVEDSGNENWK